jgi:hypothetical protein
MGNRGLCPACASPSLQAKGDDPRHGVSLYSLFVNEKNIEDRNPFLAKMAPTVTRDLFLNVMSGRPAICAFMLGTW